MLGRISVPESGTAKKHPGNRRNKKPYAGDWHGDYADDCEHNERPSDKPRDGNTASLDLVDQCADNEKQEAGVQEPEHCLTIGLTVHCVKYAFRPKQRKGSTHEHESKRCVDHADREQPFSYPGHVVSSQVVSTRIPS